MKAKIPARLTKEQQIAIRREAEKQCVEVHDAYEHALDVLIAYTLREHLGFGMDRMKKFFLAMAENQIGIKKAYSGGHVNDNTMPEFVMERRLKDVGIDLDAILADMEAHALKIQKGDD